MRVRRFRHDAVIEDDDNSGVALRSNQAPDSLTKFQDRFRQGIFGERITASRLDQFQFRFNQRMIRNREGQSCDDDVRERFAGHIHAHPKTVGPEQVRCAASS